MIHPLADVQSDQIGKDTQVWQYSIILKGARIGCSCNINCHTFIERDVQIGNSVTVKSGVYLWDGIVIEDYVFIGPNVTFTNDKWPRSKNYPIAFQKTLIKHHASIGAAATILGGVTVGEFAMIGANSLITRDVPARSLVVGCPGKVVSWVNEDGTSMTKIDEYHYRDNSNRLWQVDNNSLKLK